MFLLIFLAIVRSILPGNETAMSSTELVLFLQIAYVFDNPATVAYAIFISFWGMFEIKRPTLFQIHLRVNGCFNRISVSKRIKGAQAADWLRVGIPPMRPRFESWP